MMDDPHVLDPDYDRHGGFPQFEPAHPGPGFARFLTAMRRAQDLAVSANLDSDTWDDAADRAEELVKLLDPFEAAEGVGPANRTPELPGAGSLLMPPWSVMKFEPGGVELGVQFSRYHVGGNSAVTWRCAAAVVRLGVRHGDPRRRTTDQPNRFPARRLPQRDADRHPAYGARSCRVGGGPQGVRFRRAVRSRGQSARRKQRADGEIASRTALALTP